MDELQFACRNAFPVLVPIISRAVKQRPASPCTLLGKAGEMLTGKCLGQGGEGFSLNWEELGTQGREKDADSCTGAREPGGLGLKFRRAHKT